MSSRTAVRYLFSGMAASAAVALLLFGGLFFALQLLRLGHHLTGTGAGSGALLLARALLYSTPSLLVFSMPLALYAGVLFSLGRRGEDGELLALRALGASPLLLALPALLLGALGGLFATVLEQRVEPAASARLQRELVRAASRAMLLGAEPGRFHPLAGGGVLFVGARARAGGRPAGGVELDRLFLVGASGRGSLLLARRARLDLDEKGEVRLLLEEGELQEITPRGGLRRVRFANAEQRLDVRRLVGRGLALFESGSSLGIEKRPPLLALLSCLALSLLAAALSLLGERGRLASTLLGILLLVLFEGAQLVVAELAAAWVGEVVALGVAAASATALAGVFRLRRS